MIPLGKYVVISKKLYEVFSGKYGIMWFKYGEKMISYEKDRDGPLLDKEEAAKEYPEWLL